MMVRIPLLRLVLLAVLPAALRGADAWTQLKAGMTPDEAEAILGAPLIRNGGKGFELWIYDDCSEVVLYGGVIAWTAPAGSLAADSPRSLWRFFQAAPGELADPPPVRRVLLPAGSGLPAPGRPASAFRYQPRA